METTIFRDYVRLRECISKKTYLGQRKSPLGSEKMESRFSSPLWDSLLLFVSQHTPGALRGHQRGLKAGSIPKANSINHGFSGAILVFRGVYSQIDSNLDDELINRTVFRKALDAYFTQTNFRYHFFPKYHTYHPHQKHVHQPSHESGSTLRLEVVSFSRLDGHKPCLSTSQKFLIDFEGMIHQEESFNKQIHMTPSW